MEINEIETALMQPDVQDRLKAIAALKDYDSEVAVPMLTSKLRDSEFLVRSFVAMALGKQQTAESFAALLEMVKFDRDTNVRAEAANSLSLFGSISIPHLVSAFSRDNNWLVRRSILAALVDMDCPKPILDVCLQALTDEDLTVRGTAIDALGILASSSQHGAALSQLLQLTSSESWRMRVRVAYALKRFKEPQARDALTQLRQDEDHRVVGAALEDLL